MTSAPAARVESLPHNAALDGVRGLAILLVMVHHFTYLQRGSLLDTALLGVSKLGWTGVDLFFVLSGYLITSILRGHLGDTRYYSTFYARRVLRILPLYYLTLAFTFFVLPHVTTVVFGDSQLWFWLHASNVQLALGGAPHRTLNVTWSLAVEEQFYFFWPFVVSFAGKRFLPHACVGALVLSVLTRLAFVLVGADVVVTAVLTPCRLDGLALGALLACVPLEVMKAQRGTIALAGAVGAAGFAAILAHGRSTHMIDFAGRTLGYTFLALFLAALMASALVSPRVARAFSVRPLIALGKYSYAIYLFHLPVSAVLRDHGLGVEAWPRVGGSMALGQLAFHLLAGGSTFALAWASWRVLESPILQLKRHFRYARAQEQPGGVGNVGQTLP